MHLKGVRFGLPLMKRLGLLKHLETYVTLGEPSVYSTTFRKHVGMSPREFRAHRL